MKKWFVMAAVLCSSLIYADGESFTQRLTAKAVMKNENAYFVLSDGSCWKVMPFQTRWRSISEWWNDIELVPKNYECVPNDWYLGAEIELYSKFENLNINEADASNQSDLKKCTHLLVNKNTGHVLFGISLDAGGCLVELYNDAFLDGYNEGYRKGWNEGYESGKAVEKLQTETRQNSIN